MTQFEMLMSGKIGSNADAILETGECLVFDLVDVPGQGTIVYPPARPAVEAADVPVGHAPLLDADDRVCGVTPGAGRYAAARVESCVRDAHGWRLADAE